jgi:hypothetical protein
MISWLRNEYGQDLTRNQQAEPCEPQKAVKRVKCYQCGQEGHISRHCMVQRNKEHAGKRKGGVIHTKERAGKREGGREGGKTHTQMRENQTKQNFRKLPKFESDSEDDEGSYWFSLRESDSEDDDDFEDKYSTPAPVWYHTTSDSRRGFNMNPMFVGEKIMWNSNTGFEEVVMEAGESAVGMQVAGESVVVEAKESVVDNATVEGVQMAGERGGQCYCCGHADDRGERRGHCYCRGRANGGRERRGG